MEKEQYKYKWFTEFYPNKTRYHIVIDTPDSEISNYLLTEYMVNKEGRIYITTTKEEKEK
jgi:hypothetical protein